MYISYVMFFFNLKYMQFYYILSLVLPNTYELSFTFIYLLF